VPFDFYVWMLGLVSEGHFPMSKMRSLKVPPPFADNLWGLSHLWFLQYVFLYSVILVAWMKWAPAVPQRYRSLAYGLGVGALAAIGTVTLSWAPQVVYDFQHATLPVPSKWIYSGTFFAGGVALAIFDPGFRRLNRWCPRMSVVGLLATIAAVLLGTWALRVQSEGVNHASVDGLARVAIGLVTVLAAWTATLGVLGAFDRLAPMMARFPKLVRVIQYLAGASFWIYLIHHPILGLVQIDLKWLAPGLSPFAKSIISLLVACGWALASYEWMIRTSRFGRWIGVANALPSTASRETDRSIAVSDEPSHVVFPGGERDKSGTHRRAA
jgi:peptidoglycan/LPS O-acetylase OafA/YrhL